MLTILKQKTLLNDKWEENDDVSDWKMRRQSRRVFACNAHKIRDARQSESQYGSWDIRGKVTSET